VPAPGRADDTANFDLGRAPEDRYTVTGVSGQNDRLIVHDDSLMLVISDSFLGDDYVLLNDTDISPSLTVGVALGDVADLILEGATSSASISTRTTTIGRASLSTGLVTVDNLQWVGLGNLTVGESGSGELTIQNGADVSNAIGSIGVNGGILTSGTGTVTVTGAGSTWNNSGGLIVGVEGSGKLSIEAGGNVASVDGSIGQLTADSLGEVSVSGAGSMWNNDNRLPIGVFGSATLTVADCGSVVNTQDTHLLPADKAPGWPWRNENCKMQIEELEESRARSIDPSSNLHFALCNLIHSKLKTPSMGLNHVTVTIRASEKSRKKYQADFLVDHGAIDSMARGRELEHAGIRRRGRMAYEWADHGRCRYSRARLADGAGSRVPGFPRSRVGLMPKFRSNGWRMRVYQVSLARASG
jgi:T5SS/PEP-CTERM-associated repeat protein